jgi:ubiquinone/menaquinone biosynthesis C-methylase UbiE
MMQEVYGEDFQGSAAENYERYFVPSIGAPLAADLIETAALQPGERVLDVACGTGVITRLAAERLGGSGRLAGTDINPGMLEVARSVAVGTPIEWHEANAESLPHADGGFDTVLCQMGLQFIGNKLAALREMRRVLAPGGRVVLNLPGPAPKPMAAFAEALARHIDPQVASFLHLVFSLHEPAEVRELMESAGFRDVDVRRATKVLRLPPPEQFMWQYIHSTPMAGVVAEVDQEQRAALERDVCTQWREHCTAGGMTLHVGMTTATGRK